MAQHVENGSIRIDYEEATDALKLQAKEINVERTAFGEIPTYVRHNFV